MTELRCFGSPVLLVDGSPAALGRKKSLALVVYLAVSGRPCSRETLAALLWPEHDPAHAFGYLRTALYELTTAAGSDLMTTDRRSVSIVRAAVDVDVVRFRALCGAGSTARGADIPRLKEAVGLRGEAFLRGFSLKDAPGFDDWQRDTAEELDARYGEALASLVHASVSEGDLAAAVDQSRALVSLDELNEEHQRLLMRVLALAGRHAAVEAQYERFRCVLERELNATPADETRRLRDRLRAVRNVTDIGARGRELRDEIFFPRPSCKARDPDQGTAHPRPASCSPVALRSPSGVFVDGHDRIHIADTGNSRILRIDDMDGHGAVSFGSHGTGDGEFLCPSSVRVDPVGRVLVADTHANRIARFNGMDGSGWITFGSKGGGFGEFTSPSCACVDPLGRILVADSLNDRLARIDDMSGSGWVTLRAPPPGNGPGRFSTPGGVCVDASGWIYVASTDAGAIIRLDDLDGTGWSVLRPAWRSRRCYAPVGLCVDPRSGSLFVVNMLGWSIVRFADMTGLDWTELHGRPGGGPYLRDSFSYPSGIAIDGRGRIYIADSANDRIVRVDDITGAAWTEYPQRGTRAG